MKERGVSNASASEIRLKAGTSVRRILAIVGFGVCFTLVLQIIGNSLDPQVQDSDFPTAKTKWSAPDGRVEPWRRFRQDAHRRTADPAEPVTSAALRQPEPEASAVLKQAAQNAGGEMAQPEANQPPASEPPIDNMRIAFRLSQGKGRWIPKASITLAQVGSHAAVEVKAQSLDIKGRTIDLRPEWLPEDREMVSVSPSPHDESAVIMRVLRGGKSRLEVIANGFSRSLTINATELDNTMIVAISQ